MSQTEQRRSRGLARCHLSRWVRILLALLIVMATIWFLVISRFSDVDASYAAIQRLPPTLVVVAGLLQLLSLLCYSEPTAAVLGRSRPRYGTLLQIDLSDLTVNHTVPGGGTVAGAVRFRLFVSEDIPAAEALSAATVQISISNLALALLFVSGIALSLARLHAHLGNYVLAGVVVLVLLTAIVSAVWLLLQHTQWVAKVVRTLGRQIPFLGEERLPGLSMV